MTAIPNSHRPDAGAAPSLTSPREPRNPPEAAGQGAAHLLASQRTEFDIIEWHPHAQSCTRYFLEYAQHSSPVQVAARFLNILLPFEKEQRSHRSPVGSPRNPSSPIRPPSAVPNVSLTPYIRRMVVTGFDTPAMLHGFFGDDWAAGVGPLHEAERRNYLFAAKSGSWLEVKAHYDMPDEQSTPFLRPLQNTTEEELVGSTESWREWLKMQDWVIGPRDPDLPGPGN